MTPVWALSMDEPIVSLGEYWHDDCWPRLWWSYIVLPYRSWPPWLKLDPAES